VERAWVEALRRAVDLVDEGIVGLLKARMKLCEALARAKAVEGVPLRDFSRESVVLERAGEFREVFEEVMKLCRRIQEEKGGSTYTSSTPT